MSELTPATTDTAASEQHEAESRLPYEVVDLTAETPTDAIERLELLQGMKAEDGSQAYVFHGAHTTGFHEVYGLPDVSWNETLDPAESRQDVPAVYATTNAVGAAVHATLKHRPEDAGENGQTFSLSPNGGGAIVELSPKLQEQQEFTDGYLYVLPAGKFGESKHDSDHEVAAHREVTPVLGIKLGADIGPELMQRIDVVSYRESDQVSA